MRLKSILDNQSGFRFFFDSLSLNSSVSRQMLLETVMFQSSKEIKKSYLELEEFHRIFMVGDKFTFTLQSIKSKLSSLKDIRNTISRIEDGIVLDDIELFEIKHLALLNEEIKNLFEGTFIKSVSFENLSQVVDLLDPEGTRITSFYIYDNYSEELKILRNKIKKEEKYNSELHYKASIIEEKVREELSKQLRPFYHLLRNSIIVLAKIDIILAKALQMKELDLSIPTISKDKTSYHGLFNPQVKIQISKDGREFQKVDILLEPYVPVLITGANMGGKTVVLKTLALCQYLFQFGFGIPAIEAKIEIVSDIHFCIGDEQSIFKGLSSFAAEMERIDKLIQVVRSGKKILALIDEPARTTNPTEGTALVSSLISIMAGKVFLMVITSHYNILEEQCRRIRVKGYSNGAMNYQLIEDCSTTAPQEALQIARSLGIDNEWIENAEQLLNKNI